MGWWAGATAVGCSYHSPCLPLPMSPLLILPSAACHPTGLLWRLHRPLPRFLWLHGRGEQCPVLELKYLNPKPLGCGFCGACAELNSLATPLPFLASLTPHAPMAPPPLKCLSLLSRPPSLPPQVRIWKTVRSQEEIIKHMRWASGLENEQHLVAYWKFNDPDTDNGQFRCVCALRAGRGGLVSVSV